MSEIEKKGYFISFEGPDGSGKSTQMAILEERLKANGVDFLRPREPGSTVIGEKVREILHSREHEEMASSTELLLYSAARAQLVTQILSPELARGRLVIVDRFFDSTHAYQGYGRGIDMSVIDVITKFATDGLRPDMTLLININPEEGLRRRSSDPKAEWNRLDALALEFHQKVYDGYQIIAAANKDRIIPINGERSIDKVSEEIWNIVSSKLIESGHLRFADDQIRRVRI